MLTALSFLFTESLSIYSVVQQLLICQQRGAMDRSYEKPTRLSARPDGAIGCRVCARHGEEPLALGT
jgi:hypothetical protein